MTLHSSPMCWDGELLKQVLGKHFESAERPAEPLCQVLEMYNQSLGLQLLNVWLFPDLSVCTLRMPFGAFALLEYGSKGCLRFGPC